MDDIYDTLVQFISENISSWQEEEVLPDEVWKKISELNLIGLARTEKAGMKEFGKLIKKLCEFKRIGLIAAYAINEIVVNLVNTFKGQIDDNMIASVNRGEKKLALCITEENAGSDMAAVVTYAEEREDSYVINGKKILISNGPVADYYIVAAKTNTNVPAYVGISVFFVHKNTPGLTVIGPVPKAGINLMPLGELLFENVEVKKDCLIGRKNRGFQYLINALNFERTIISVVAMNLCEKILGETNGFIGERTVFATKLKDFQSIKFKMAALFAKVQVLRTFVDNLIENQDNGICDKNNILIAKYMTTELLKEIALTCINTYGGKGFLTSHWAANLFNEVRWTSFAGGSNDVILDVIGNSVVNRSNNL